MNNTTCSLRLVVGMIGVVGFASLHINTAYSDAGGKSGYSGSSGRTCTSCHSGGTTPTISLTGPASVAAGATGTYTLTINGGPGSNAGMDAAATGGTLIATAAGTQILRSEVVQSSATPFSGGSVTYTFDWQAPATAGTYTIFATGLSGDGNGSDTGDGTAATSVSVAVTGGANVPPVAVITGPTTATAGTQVIFDGSGSSDPDGSIATYAWDFGDGTAGAGVTTPHTFSAGNYTVMLTVTDNSAATNSASVNIVVTAAGGGGTTNLAPTANAGGPYTGTAGTTVAFNGSGSSDPDGTIASYSWSFGDGSMGTGVQPTHTYTAQGNYTVRLVVTDNGGATGQSQTSAAISAATPQTPGPTTVGADLYAEHCASCHGDGGSGGPDGSVLGESVSDIREAIREEKDMRSLATILTADDIKAIAAYLRTRGEDDGDGDDDEEEEDFAGPSTSDGSIGGTRGDRATTTDSTASAGALDVLTLIGAGAWFARRRKKS